MQAPVQSCHYLFAVHLKEVGKFAEVRILWQEGLPKTISENLWSQLKMENFSLVKEMSCLLKKCLTC